MQPRNVSLQEAVLDRGRSTPVIHELDLLCGTPGRRVYRAAVFSFLLSSVSTAGLGGGLS